MLTRIRLAVDRIQVDRDTKPLLAYLQDYQESFYVLTKLLEGRKVLRLTYEDDVSVDPLVGHQRICNFLGLDYHQVSIRYSKVNPFKLSDMIINFEEVERTLGGSRFEWMPYQ